MKRGNFVVPAALALAALTAACGLRQEGVSDRCADMVSAAWPDGVKIATRRASVADGAETADVTGTASGTEVAARCRFEHDVLTDFRWIAGPAAVASGSGSSTPPPKGGGHQ